jgi:cation diffusion facilitator CzcD-associated flavoprotein CzcO
MVQKIKTYFYLRNIKSKSKPYSVGIIGCGVGGITAAKRALDLGLTPLLFDIESDFGGTWLKNSYYDAACDVPIVAYSFSFSPRATWSRKWAKRDEILSYVQDVARNELKLNPFTKFCTRVNSCRFDGKKWHIYTTNLITNQNEIHITNFLIGATGQLNIPHVPSTIENALQFKGESIHTAKWPNHVSFEGKKVACIGTGASAIQALPVVAKECKELVVFQRSPGYVVRKFDFEYPWWATLLLRVPLFRAMYRYYVLGLMDIIWYLMVPNSNQSPPAKSNQLLQRYVQDQMKSQTSKPDDLIPAREENIGCKRLLISDDWLPMFEQSNVKLVKSPIIQVDGKSLIDQNGNRHGEFDCLIFATGFDTSTFLKGIEIINETSSSSGSTNHSTLHEYWNGIPKAYLGLTVPHFPNFALVYGPNTNVNHTSVLALMECGLEHFFTLVQHVILNNEMSSFEIKEEAFHQYNNEEQYLLKKSVFNSNCDSWYKKNPTHSIINNYHGSLLGYYVATCWWNKWDDYIFR